MKRLFVIMFFLAIATFILAKPIGLAAAGDIAMSWLEQTNPAAMTSVSLDQVQPYQTDSTRKQTIFVVTLRPAGFILVSPDDRVKPILGFSLDSTFLNNQKAEAVRWFLASYLEQIQQITSDATLSAHPEWQQIRTHTLPSTRTDRDVIPLLTTTWNQSTPYNEMCPVDATLPGGHVKAGCMATALSQVIKYWSYPTHGIGENSYTLNPWGEISADFEAATYNYTSMPNNLTNSPDADISLLMFHTGVAMDMQYSATGSVATPANARAALVEHFSYSSSAILRNLNETGATDWVDYLVSDLELARPIIQYGTETGGANPHAWVVDGVLNTDYFHVNWGMGGTFNGFYYMNNLHPGQYWFNTNIGGIFEVRPFALVPAPLNLTATVQSFVNVNLQWQPVTEILPTGYEIYRNNTLLTTINNPNAQLYIDLDLAPGTYTYYLKTLSLYGSSDPSNTATVMVFSPPVINYTTSFETMTDYATLGFPWQTFDIDHAPTVTVSGYDYPNEGAAGSFFTIRPLYMIPPNWDITMHQGFKAAASFGAVNVPNNDWLITPIWNTGNIAQIRFWAKSDVGTHSASLLKVGYSTDPANPTQMTLLSGPTPITLPNVWTEYVFDITGHFSQNVVVCFQNVSTDGYLLLIDDVTLNTGVANDDNTDTQTPALANLKVYPNPARGSVNISFNTKANTPSSISIFDTKGRLVKTISDVSAESSTQNHIWDGVDNNGDTVPNGMYLLKVASGKQTQTRKVVYLSK